MLFTWIIATGGHIYRDIPDTLEKCLKSNTGSNLGLFYQNMLIALNQAIYEVAQANNVDIDL